MSDINDQEKEHELLKPRAETSLAYGPHIFLRADRIGEALAELVARFSEREYRQWQEKER